MKYHVRLDGGDAEEIELRERGESLFLVTADGEIPVELAPVRNGSSYSLLLGQQSLPVVVAGPNDDMVLTLGSETWHAQVQDEREAIAGAAGAGSGGAAGGGLVRSQMPGIVRELRVAVGDTVEKGQPLAILEAMKMQNEIRAPGAGTVTKVHVVAGTAVAKGDSLVTIA